MSKPRPIQDTIYDAIEHFYAANILPPSQITLTHEDGTALMAELQADGLMSHDGQILIQWPILKREAVPLICPVEDADKVPDVVELSHLSIPYGHALAIAETEYRAGASPTYIEFIEIKLFDIVIRWPAKKLAIKWSDKAVRY